MRGSLGSELSLFVFRWRKRFSPLHFEEGQVRMSFTLREQNAVSREAPLILSNAFNDIEAKRYSCTILAQPNYFAAFGMGLITRIGLDTPTRMFNATLPYTRRLKPERPWVAITMRLCGVLLA